MCKSLNGGNFSKHLKFSSHNKRTRPAGLVYSSDFYISINLAHNTGENHLVCIKLQMLKWYLCVYVFKSLPWKSPCIQYFLTRKSIPRLRVCIYTSFVTLYEENRNARFLIGMWRLKISKLRVSNLFYILFVNNLIYMQSHCW